MPRFTYQQCDLIHKKMSNFNSVIGKAQMGTSMIDKQLSRKESSHRLGDRRPLVDKDANVQRDLMRRYESGGLELANNNQKGFRDHREARNYGKENDCYYLDVEIKKRNPKKYDYQNHQALKNFKTPTTNPSSHMIKPPLSKAIPGNQQSMLLQYSSIHPYLNQTASHTSISHILEQGYSSIPTAIPNYHLSQQKSQTIHQLNSQIKKIMEKYDYEFNQQEIRGLVGERITLPSFRDKQIKDGERITDQALRINDNRGIAKVSDQKEKISSGYIRVEDSVSEQEIPPHQNTNQISSQNNQFSPYSNKQPSLNNYQTHRRPAMTTKLMIKKQTPQINHNKPTKANTNCINSQDYNSNNQLQLNKHITMCRSQLIEDKDNKNKKDININRGQYQVDFIAQNADQPYRAALQSSQKKKARYLAGYINLPADPSENSNPKPNLNSTIQPRRHHRNTRLTDNWMPKNRSQFIDKSIEELNQRIQQVEKKKKKLGVQLRPFNLQRFKGKLMGNQYSGLANGDLQGFYSFQMKKQVVQQHGPLAKYEAQTNMKNQYFSLQNTHKTQDQPQSLINNQTPQHLPIQIISPQTQQTSPNNTIQKQPTQTTLHQTCQIDSLFNNVSLKVKTSEEKSPQDSNLYQKDFVSDREKVNSQLVKEQILDKEKRPITQMFRAINIRHQNRTHEHLSLVSGINVVTITKDQSVRTKDQSLRAKGQSLGAKYQSLGAKYQSVRAKDQSVRAKDQFVRGKDEWVQFSTQEEGQIRQLMLETHSAQKRLNRSSLLIKKPQNTKNSFQLLLINLIQQISLDQQFRNLKTWFQFYHNHENKYQEVRKMFFERLEKRKQTLKVRKQFQDNLGIQSENRIVKVMERDLGQVDSVFGVSVNQHDPFFKLDDNCIKTQSNRCQIHKNAHSSINHLTHYCLQSLFHTYQTSLTFWTTHLDKKFSSKPLLCSGFSAQHLDLQRKGYIELQDLVRVINMNVGTCYRSRDLVMIWDRICSVKAKEMQTIGKKEKENGLQHNGKTQRIEFRYVLMAFTEKDKI